MLAYVIKKYPVASKCSLNHFISEKYKIVRSFKLHLPPNNPFVQLYTSVSDCKDAENISGSHFVKAVKLFRRIFNDVNIIT